MTSQPKRLCTENMSAKKIGTHNGTFHCDEVLACFFLRQLPEYKVGTLHGSVIKTLRLRMITDVVFALLYVVQLYVGIVC